MTDKERSAEIVKSGTWLYDNQVPHEVWIVRQNFDYYYEEDLDDGPEQLNSEGVLFNLVFTYQGTVRTIGPAKMSLDDAISEAEERLAEHQLRWTDVLLQKLYAPYYSLAEDSNGEASANVVFKTAVD